MQTEDMDPVTLLFDIRPDLIDTFAVVHNEWSTELLAWLVFNGVNEYPSLKRSNSLKKKLLEKKPEPCGLTHLEEVVYASRRDLQDVFPLPSRRAELLVWFSHHLLKEYDFGWLYEAKEEKKCVGPKRKGVNVFGYAYGASGIGEDFRTTYKALKESGISVAGVNFDPGPNHPQDFNEYSEPDAYDPSLAVNIFCMTAPETARQLVSSEKDIFSGHYNVGYWPWELEAWPAAWLKYIDLVDEMWVSSRYIYDAVAHTSKKPVMIMPLNVTIPEYTQVSRDDFGLPSTAFLFVFVFDLGSSSYRKNPKSCLEAFWAAFPPSLYSPGEVGLVIKVHAPKVFDQIWQDVKSAASSDKRIFIIEETFTKKRLCQLYRSCDCFLSFHRAEGYGRNVAEALQLGLHVIATGHSGNMEFCNSENTIFPRHTFEPVKEGEYAYALGRWAEVDVLDAAQKMKDLFFEGVKKDTSIGELPFSLSQCKERYKKRLEFIFNNLAVGVDHEQ